MSFYTDPRLQMALVMEYMPSLRRKNKSQGVEPISEFQQSFIKSSAPPLGTFVNSIDCALCRAELVGRRIYGLLRLSERCGESASWCFKYSHKCHIRFQGRMT